MAWIRIPENRLRSALFFPSSKFIAAQAVKDNPGETLIYLEGINSGGFIVGHPIADVFSYFDKNKAPKPEGSS